MGWWQRCEKRPRIWLVWHLGYPKLPLYYTINLRGKNSLYSFQRKIFHQSPLIAIKSVWHNDAAASHTFIPSSPHTSACIISPGDFSSPSVAWQRTLNGEMRRKANGRNEWKKGLLASLSSIGRSDEKNQFSCEMLMLLYSVSKVWYKKKSFHYEWKNSLKIAITWRRKKNYSSWQQQKARIMLFCAVAFRALNFYYDGGREGELVNRVR